MMEIRDLCFSLPKRSSKNSRANYRVNIHGLSCWPSQKKSPYAGNTNISQKPTQLLDHFSKAKHTYPCSTTWYCASLTGCSALIPSSYSFVLRSLFWTSLVYRLNVEVAYAPESSPDPFSMLCEAAYRRNTTIPGPDEDPDGWFTLPHANIHGKLCFNGRHAHLRCTVSRSYSYRMLGCNINSPYSSLLPNQYIFFSLSTHSRQSTDPFCSAMLLSWSCDSLSSQHP